MREKIVKEILQFDKYDKQVTEGFLDNCRTIDSDCFVYYMILESNGVKYLYNHQLKGLYLTIVFKKMVIPDCCFEDIVKKFKTAWVNAGFGNI